MNISRIYLSFIINFLSKNDKFGGNNIQNTSKNTIKIQEKDPENIENVPDLSLLVLSELVNEGLKLVDEIKSAPLIYGATIIIVYVLQGIIIV